MAALMHFITIEASLKRKGRVYDFADFVDAVQKARRTSNVIQMTLKKMFVWRDGTSQYKLNKIIPRPYLSEMVQVTFSRGHNTLTYETSFEEESGPEINILNAHDHKDGIRKPKNQLQHKEISSERKRTLLNKLSPIIPPLRLLFWDTLPEIVNEELLTDEQNVFFCSLIVFL
ncbi:unnamed protein product [Psylliodes chrysocephalus]|uniref:Uncharacterized protein n=1 Tax=Psylliodes chrysocephalus TaxID=3402493 RepID=A0A9P0D021_9CUCU|nr:unnamed protein product [Psylliodes chrysocephala]